MHAIDFVMLLFMIAIGLFVLVKVVLGDKS